MPRAPKISVVMPVYNQSHLAANAMLSIVGQTFKDWELIVVDDGSWDGAKLKDTANHFKDERIKYVRLPENMGLVEARNAGNALAEGKYIIIQDADDLSLPDRLEKCANAIGDAPWLIHGAYRTFWDHEHNAMHREYIPAEGWDFDRLEKEQYLPGWPMFEKSLWQKRPFRLETQYSYDWMMLLDFAHEAGVPVLLDEGLYEYVRQSGSASDRFEKSGQRQQSMAKIKEIIAHDYA